MRQWSSKQLKVLRSLYENDERFTLVYGAVGSGKTAVASAALVLWSTTVNQELIGLVAKTTAQTKDVVIPEIVKCCGELGIRFEKIDGQRFRVGRNISGHSTVMTLLLSRGFRDITWPGCTWTKSSTCPR